jgi:hypothetical protein
MIEMGKIIYDYDGLQISRSEDEGDTRYNAYYADNYIRNLTQWGSPLSEENILGKMISGGESYKRMHPEEVKEYDEKMDKYMSEWLDRERPHLSMDDTPRQIVRDYMEDSFASVPVEKRAASYDKWVSLTENAPEISREDIVRKQMEEIVDHGAFGDSYADSETIDFPLADGAKIQFDVHFIKRNEFSVEDCENYPDREEIGSDWSVDVIDVDGKQQQIDRGFCWEEEFIGYSKELEDVMNTHGGLDEDTAEEFGVPFVEQEKTPEKEFEVIQGVKINDMDFYSKGSITDNFDVSELTNEQAIFLLDKTNDQYNETMQTISEMEDDDEDMGWYRDDEDNELDSIDSLEYELYDVRGLTHKEVGVDTINHPYDENDESHGLNNGLGINLNKGMNL